MHRASPGTAWWQQARYNTPWQRLQSRPAVSQDQLTVADFPGWAVLEAQGADEFIPIIDASISGEGKVTGLADQRQCLLEGLGRCPQHPVAETDRPITPHTRTVRTPVSEADQHPVDIRTVRRPTVRVVYPREPTHGLFPSRGGNGVKRKGTSVPPITILP